MWRAPGMLDLAVLSVFGFSGYAALLATAPLWAVSGGATAAGAGLVNGVLLTATVLAQLAVPRAMAGWGTGRVLVAGLLLLGGPAPLYICCRTGSAGSSRLSAVRGLGFGILTVVGSTVVAQLVPAGRRGAAIGVYGLAVAVPNLVLLPGSVPLVDRWGFAPIFWVAALPLLGVPSALRLTRVLRDTGRRLGRPGRSGSSGSLRSVGRHRAADLVLFSVTMAGGALLTFAPQLTDSGTAALVLLIMGLTAALSRWLVGGARGPARRPSLPRPGTRLCRRRDGVVPHGRWPASRGIVLIAAATAVRPVLRRACRISPWWWRSPPSSRRSCPPRAPAGTSGSTPGPRPARSSPASLATAYSFPVSLATLAAICLLTASSP